MAGKSKSRHKHPDFADLNISGLGEHARAGKKLSPPLAKLENRQFVSWIDEGIPDVLWACLLAGNLERAHYLDLFRKVAAAGRENLPNYETTGLTHTKIAKLSAAEFSVMFGPVIADDKAKKILAALLVLDCLPDRALWAEHLEKIDDSDAWDFLARGVFACIDHQSEPSTDVRWIKVIYMFLTGRMRFPEKMKEEIEELRLFPDKGDMRSVRPSIRAMEPATRAIGDEEHEAAVLLGEGFWQECWKKTPCIYGSEESPEEVDGRTLYAEVSFVIAKVAEHFHKTTVGTATDARHDGAFGLVLYALRLLLEASLGNNSIIVTGRLLLRSIVETFITMHYLVQKDDPTVWLQFRAYGAGQAKLAFLKNIQDEAVPSFMDLHMLERLANEDMWMEFSEIDLGAWGGLGLRQKAIDAGCKDVYDKLYDFLSGYSHGHWVCVRDTAFTTCLNPLHRLHRIPGPPVPRRSVLEDGCRLINRMLDDLNHLYSSLKVRLTWHKGEDNTQSG